MFVNASARFPPPDTFYYLKSTHPKQQQQSQPRRGADSHPLWHDERAVCWMRREHTAMAFDVFPSLDAALHYALAGRMRDERCYYAMVRPQRPVEWYMDAEIDHIYCNTLGTSPLLQQDFTTLIYIIMAWMRVSVEALFGVSSAQRGAQTWLLRADTEKKFSCHAHVPQWVFASIEDLSTTMRLVEDVLYTQAVVGSSRAGGPHPLARALCYSVADRHRRIRPACITLPQVDSQVPTTLGLIADMCVYSEIRHMRMALQRTRPSLANPLQLFQPSCQLRADDDTLSGEALRADDPVGETSRLSGADLMLQTMVCTERARRRVTMPTLLQVADHEALATTQCERLVSAVEAYLQKSSSSSAADRELDRVLLDVWRNWLGDMWRVYMQGSGTPLFTGEGGYEALLEFLVGRFHALCRLASDGDDCHDDAVLRAVLTAMHRCAWYAALIVRWHLRPRLRDMERVDSAPIFVILQRPLECLFTYHHLHAQQSDTMIGVLYEMGVLARALLGVTFASDTDDTLADVLPLLTLYGAECAPKNVFSLVVANVRLELFWHHINNPPLSQQNTDQPRHQSIADHAAFERAWNHTGRAYPRSLLYMAVRRGLLYHPHVGAMVTYIRRSGGKSTTTFAGAARHMNGDGGVAARHMNGDGGVAARHMNGDGGVAGASAGTSVSVCEKSIVGPAFGMTFLAHGTDSAASFDNASVVPRAELLKHYGACPPTLLHLEFAPPTGAE
jgi:hypothetical protein